MINMQILINNQNNNSDSLRETKNNNLMLAWGKANWLPKDSRICTQGTMNVDTTSHNNPSIVKVVHSLDQSGG